MLSTINGTREYKLISADGHLSEPRDLWISWKTINATFWDVPDDERHAILAGNAMRIFGFGKAPH